MNILLLLTILLFPVASFAQTMWPVPQSDGTILYVPMGNGTPPQWTTPNNQGGHNVIPNWVPPARVYVAPSYTPPPLTVPAYTNKYADTGDVHDRVYQFIRDR